MKQLQKYLFISKTLFFPAEGILVIGDLHIGYEHLLHEAGVDVPLNLNKQILDELKLILTHVKAQYSLNKIVFIGDLKHFFNAEYEEKKEFFKILNLVEKYVKNPSSDIILIKGNHDTFDFSGKKMKDVFIEKDIAFTHGHEWFKELDDSKIKYVVMGHLHPSIRLSDVSKSEKFKCFLTGNYEKKEFIVMPSFFNIIEGTDVNDYFDKEMFSNYFSILPRKALLRFYIHAVNEKENEICEVLDFGQVKDV